MPVVRVEITPGVVVVTWFSALDTPESSTPRSDSQLPSLSTAEVMFPAMSSRCALSPPTTTTTTATTTAMTSRSTITAPIARGTRCRCSSATSGEATVATIPKVNASSMNE